MFSKLSSWACIVMVLCIIVVSTASAETIIVANESSRTQQSSPDTNVSAERLVVRVGGGDPTRTYKCWVKFDISGLDVSNLKAATLVITFQRERGACAYDISYVHDDVFDNIDWTTDDLTWNTAPGNDPDSETALDPDKTTLLGRVQTATGLLGEPLTVDVLEVLESDTDGIVQFVLHNSSSYLNLASHEDPNESWRPHLLVLEGIKGKARKPSPADGAEDVDRLSILGWRPGGFADKHDVYFGTDFDDVNDGVALVSPGQDANSYDPGRLEFGQTYFWRIDKINAPPDSTVVQGDVWNFTTEPYAYPLSNVIAAASSSLNPDSGPEKTVDGSGLNDADQHDTANEHMWLSAVGQQPPVWIQYEFDGVYKLHEMWVWNANSGLESLVGLGVKTATIEYSTDGTAWTALANVPEFAQAPGTPGYAANTTVDLGGVAAKFVRLTIADNWGGLGQYGLSEVRFFYIPVLPREPRPGSGATGVSLDTTLTWRPGREAATHRVHFGADSEAVANGTALIDSVAAPAYGLADLNLGTTYYWKIDEVNEIETSSVWEGPVWDFTTTEYVVVDDFENYSGEEGQEIFSTWIDGYNVADNGSQVGHDLPPYVERTTVHGGRQSMPLYYGQNGASQSEVSRTFAPAQDWTRSGITALVLFFQGQAANVSGDLYVAINGAEVSYSGDAGDLAAGEWKQWNITLPAGANLGSVKTLTIGVSGGQGMLYIDDLCLYRSAPAVNP